MDTITNIRRGLGLRLFTLMLTLMAGVATADSSLVDALNASDINASDLTLAGYLDAGYTYSFNKGETVSNRLFDSNADTFDLHQAALIAAYLPAEGFGAKTVVVGGTDAKILNAFYGSDSNSDFALFIADVQYVHGPLTVMAGRYPALSGAELALAPLNTNISRSLVLTFAQPVPLTGARALYKAADSLTLALGVANSASFGPAAALDDNSQKTIEAGFAYSPTSAIKLSVYDYDGRESAANGGKLNYIDLVASFKLTNSLSLIFNGDDRHADSGTTKGGAAYLDYQWTPAFSTSLRFELLQIDTVPTADDEHLREVTLSATYAATKHFRVMGEVRADHSSPDGIDDGVTVFNIPRLVDHGGTVELSAIYSFGGI